MNSQLRAVGCAILAVIGTGAYAKELWLDAAASAGGNGTQASPYNAMSQVKNAIQYLSQDAVIHIAPGTYDALELPNWTGDYVFSFLGEGTEANPVIIDGKGETRCLAGHKAAEFQKSLIVENIIFTNGVAGSNLNGGGVFWKSIKYIKNCTFAGCSAPSGCGGAVASTNPGAFTNCVFRNCSSKSGAGAVYASQDLNVDAHFVACTFDSCTTDGNGGAVNLTRPDSLSTVDIGCVIEGCTFTNNTAASGGALWTMRVRSCTDSTFVDNRASADAGVLGGNGTNEGSNRFERCVFRANRAGTKGAFSSYNTDYGTGGTRRFTRFEGCTFADNVAESGEALMVGGINSIVMTNCTVTGNEGVGLINLSNAKVNFNDTYRSHFLHSTFANNKVGGGSLFSAGTHTMWIDGCTFSGNVDDNVIFVKFESDMAFTNVIRNCLFSQNTNASSVVYFFWAQAQSVDFCGNTLVDNRSGATPAAFWSTYVTAVRHTGIVANNIIYNNRGLGGETVSQIPRNWWDPNFKWAQYCWLERDDDTAQMSGVNHCIVGTDLGFRTEGDICYLPGSSCKNKGLFFDWMSGATDARGAGFPRVVGRAPDIGCYEAGAQGLFLIVR